MTQEVAIIGVGQSAFVRDYTGSIRELAFEAYKEAMEDANLTVKDIGASIICSAPEYDKQRTPAGVLAEYLGLNPKPTFYVESVCSSSSMGLRVAYSLIKSGLHDVVLVLGFQKMSEISSADSQERMGRGADIMWESPFGTMMPAYYAMHARAHFAKYGTTEEDLAFIRVKAANYGSMNPKAVYRKEVSLEQAMDSDMVSTPLKRFDCCANADGSSCIIVAKGEKAVRMAEKPVWIVGLGAASAPLNMTGRDSLTSLSVAREAALQAYEMAGVGPGEGIKLIRERQTYAGGTIPVNVDGGLLSKGHPIGATGGSQVRTIVLQLRGEAGPVQVKDARNGLVHNIGGVGIYGNVTILGRG
jgi:acetyl-CoA C-acetyltransferase